MTTVPVTPLTHTERARAVLAHMRGIKELIADFQHPGTFDPRTLNSVKSLPPEFFEMLAVSIEATSELANMSRITPAELRDAAEFVAAFTPVIEEHAINRRSTMYTIAVKMAAVGQLALQAYEFAKNLHNRKTQPRVIVPHLDAMKAALGRGRKKILPSSEAPATAAEPPKTAATGGTHA